MKKFSASLVVLAAALSVNSAAHADTTPGWYAAPGVALSFGENPTVHAPGAKYDVRTENTNAGFLGSAGYAFYSGLRLEGEYLHDQHNYIRANDISSNGHLSENALLLNALYDFKTDTILTPYIGAGIGPDFVHIENAGIPSAYMHGDAVVAAYQGIVGVSAQLDYNWAVTADYRYVGSFDPKVSYSPGGEARLSNASQNFVLGVRYSFAAEPAPYQEPPAMREIQPPAVRAPAPPPKPAVAPVEENFTVFFDFDKSTLTPEAKNIIAAAAGKFKAGGFARIIVIGHTDTVGPKSYNQKLSERRALAVKAELTRLGVGGANIKEKGVGEDGLLVPTTQGVREAQNRRAEIDLVK